MMTFLLISALLVVLYLGAATWRLRKLPDSVSALVYDLPKKWQWVWSAWLALVTALLAPALTEAMPSEWYAIAAHIFIICLAMTAAMPLVPGSHNRAHYGLSIAAGIFSQVCVAIIGPWWLLVWLLFVGIFFYAITGKDKSVFDGKGVLVIEIICSLSLIGCLIWKLM